MTFPKLWPCEEESPGGAKIKMGVKGKSIRRDQRRNSQDALIEKD